MPVSTQLRKDENSTRILYKILQPKRSSEHENFNGKLRKVNKLFLKRNIFDEVHEMSHIVALE